MGKRDTSRDPKGLRNWLTRHKWLWTFIQTIPGLNRFANWYLLTKAIAPIEARPEPLCTGWRYTTWESLTNRRWSSRHLPPHPQDNLPAAETVAEELFLRDEDGFRPSPKSTLLFPYFAQWLVDGFLVGDAVDRRRNYSNHQIDLCQLYGLRHELTDLIREQRGGRLKSEDDGNGEFPPKLYGSNGTVKPEFSIKREGYPGFVDVGAMPIFVDKQDTEVGMHVPDLELKYGHEFPDGTVLPRHLVFREIPRQERVFEIERAHPERLRELFAIANDRGNATPAFTMMSTLFLREHNRIARTLDEAYGWEDERTFQTTRNILIVILLRIVIEEYINHITPYHFKFFADPESFFKPYAWKWQNWMTTEFQLLYRWHSMIPDRLTLGNDAIPTRESLWNPGLLVQHGLANMFQYASDQTSGEIGAKNTWKWLVEMTDIPSIKMGRLCEIKPYNEYRALCDLPRITDFDQITADESVQAALKRLYGSVDQIEYYSGIFCEDVRPNSALAPLIGVMVGADAFSQALPNPLLQKRIWNRDTFSRVGWDIIHEQPHTLEALLKRNTPELSSTERDALSISMTRKDWKRT